MAKWSRLPPRLLLPSATNFTTLRRWVLFRTGDPAIQGVVYRVVTELLDAGRPVLARGESAATEDQVFRANPQLERLLTSRFEVLILGHHARGVDLPVLPPLPPWVHAFVYACSPEETVRLAESPG